MTEPIDTVRYGNHDRILLVGHRSGLKSLASKMIGHLPLDHWAMAPVDLPPVVYTETDVRIFEATQKLMLDTTPPTDYDDPMTTHDWRDSYSYDDEPLADDDLFDSDEGVCQWLMESFNEDGPCTIMCGRDVERDERRALCAWHASAMSIPDTEFERRVEAGETWS